MSSHHLSLCCLNNATTSLFGGALLLPFAAHCRSVSLSAGACRSYRAPGRMLHRAAPVVTRCAVYLGHRGPPRPQAKPAAAAETVSLLPRPPPLPLVGGSIEMERGCQQNDSLVTRANRQPLLPACQSADTGLGCPQSSRGKAFTRCTLLHPAALCPLCSSTCLCTQPLPLPLPVPPAPAPAPALAAAAAVPCCCWPLLRTAARCPMCSVSGFCTPAAA